MRTGVTLPELILVAWLFALVLAATARFAGAQSRLVATTHDRTRVAEASRVPGTILAAELRALADRDFVALSPDSIRIRAVRGGGPLCRVHGSAAVVRYRGVRLPDPAKDSVLLVVGYNPEGVVFPVLDAATDTSCGGALRLELGSTFDLPGGWALVFETGSYHVSGGALRYRRGGGGRQPMTESVFNGGGFTDLGSAGLEIGLELDPDSLPRLLPAATVRVRLPLLNRESP